MANGSYCAFHSTNCHTKCFLIKMYCLALYGCCIWSLDSPGFSVIEIAFNKILRKIWNLPSHSHTSTVHCVANIPTIRNIVHKRFFVFIRQCLSSASSLVSRIMFDSCYYAYNSIGYNFLYSDSHVCSPYSEDTLIYSSKIQLIRKIFGTVSPFKGLIRFFPVLKPVVFNFSFSLYPCGMCNINNNNNRHAKTHAHKNNHHDYG